MGVILAAKRRVKLAECYAIRLARVEVRLLDLPDETRLHQILLFATVPHKTQAPVCEDTLALSCSCLQAAADVVANTLIPASDVCVAGTFRIHWPPVGC